MRPAQIKPRNPGPNWGFGFLLWAERRWPRWFFRPLLMAGTWVGLAFMPAQRVHSRAYLSVVLGRPARLIEVWRHFFAFAEFLVLRIRAGRGVAIASTLRPENAPPFEALMRSDRPALLGTFHFGVSDLLGYLLVKWDRRVAIVRMKVGNSGDTRLLGQRFGDQVSIVWINHPAELLFALKAAIENGETVALQCDRPEHTSKTEAFRFLGANRVFPVTIYHLGILFDRPVAFCMAVPLADDADHIEVFATPVFTPDPALDREGNLAAARIHFQGVLTKLESLVRAHPCLWFNFLPLNPVADDQARG